MYQVGPVLALLRLSSRYVQVIWESITAALHEIGYDGAVVIESFIPDNQTIARAAAIWRPLAESQNVLARDGLAFLRGAFA